MNFEEINPLWRLCDPLSVHQAAALIANYDPGLVRFNSEGQPGWFENEVGEKETDGISWVRTALAALINAVMAGNLKAKVIHDSRPLDASDSQNLRDLLEVGEYFSPSYESLCDGDEVYKNGYFIKNEPNWGKTLINRESLIEWLRNNGVTTGFLFRNVVKAAPDYLDHLNSRYAPKLAAAVKAWQAVTVSNGQSPKQALTKWLREHAAEFNMTDDEGKINETGIEEVAKVANWQLGGGAPKTPGE